VIVMELLLWSSVGLIIYAYVGYPLVLGLIGLVHRAAVKRADITPTVTLIITAYNEERRIAEKLDNTLKLDYPTSLLEVIVASDCSSDRTDEIVKAYADRGIELVRAPLRKGKEAAQKLAVDVAKGEVLVFSDVATVLPANAVRNIVRNFHDETVGCVSSVDQFIDKDGRISGEGGYVRYEMFLRKLESRVNSLVGLSGSFFAARRAMCQPWADDLQSDFNTLLNSVEKGMRGVSDPDSVGCYRNLTDETKEYQRKVRTVLRGLTVIARRRTMLNPFRHGMFAWQLFSHKLCRWLVPFGLLGGVIGNVILASESTFYIMLLILQAGFYSLAAVGIVSEVANRSVIKLAAFFVVVNVSILNAWVQFLTGYRVVAWDSSRR